MRFLRFWRRMSAGDPGNFLRLLIRAQEIQEQDASVSAAFRAGVRVGAEHPELAAWLTATTEERQ